MPVSHSSGTPLRVAIVGGGIAGLSAAFFLRQQQPLVEVELFEASHRLGGAIRTEANSGYLIEHGADMFATEPPAAIELCRQLGIENELIKPLTEARGAAIVQGSRLVRVPEGFVLMRPTLLWPMIKTPLLSLAGKLRLLAEPFVRTRTAPEDESIESFVTRRLGRETLDRIVQPLVGGIYTGDVAKLSMAATMPQFRQMELQYGSLYRATLQRMRAGADSTEKNSAGARYENFRSFPTGMNRFIDALVATLEPESVHLSTPIKSVVRNEQGWQVVTNEGLHANRFDHVILATPARIAAKQVQEVAPEASRLLSQIPFASSAVVVFGLQRKQLTRTMPIAGFIVPIRERRRILAVSFTGAKFAGRTPDGCQLLRVFFGGELQRELLQHSDDELVDIAKAELRELLGLDGEPELTKVVRWNEAMPQYLVGHQERLRELETVLTKHPGLSIVGYSMRGVGIAPTISLSQKTVSEILACAPSGSQPAVS